jgi:hypothetical protein
MGQPGPGLEADPSGLKANLRGHGSIQVSPWLWPCWPNGQHGSTKTYTTSFKHIMLDVTNI